MTTARQQSVFKRESDVTHDYANTNIGHNHGRRVSNPALFVDTMTLGTVYEDVRDPQTEESRDDVKAEMLDTRMRWMVVAFSRVSQERFIWPEVLLTPLG